MKQILRYSMLCLLVLICGVANATVIDITGQSITVTDDGFTLTVGEYTFTAVKNDNKSKPTQNSTYKDIRLYAKNSITISGPAMTKLVFTMSTKGLQRWAPLTADKGTVSINKDNGTTIWTSEEPVTSVVLTVGEKAEYGTDGAGAPGQFDFNKVAVNEGGETGGEPGTGEGGETTTDKVVYDNTLVNNTGDFTIKDVILPEALSYVWKNNNFGWVASGFKNGAGAQKAESWIISPAMVLPSESAKMVFDHALNKGTHADQGVYISTDQENWTEVTVPNWPAGNSWNFISSGDVDLSAFKGQKIFIGFKYASTADNAPSWEIKNLKVTGTGDIVGPAKAESAWAKSYVETKVNGTAENTFTTNSNGAVTYSSSNPDVATIDANGKITVLGVVGVTEITAETAETAEYLASSESFKLAVVEHDGTMESPYNCAEVACLYDNNTEVVWIKGYIVGYINGTSNSGFDPDVPRDTVQTEIVIADTEDETEITKCVAVQLPTGFIREALDLYTNPSNIGKVVWLQGKMQKYFGMAGLKSTAAYSFDGTTGINNVAIDNKRNNIIYNLNGQRIERLQKGINIINGKKIVVK